MKFTSKRPWDSSIVTISAGAFIVAIGTIAIKGYFNSGDTSTLDLALIAFGTSSGVIVALSGILAIYYTSSHSLLGIAAIAFSVTSFVGTSGGLYVGAFIGIIGGAMTVSWHPDDGLDKETGEVQAKN